MSVNFRPRFKGDVTVRCAKIKMERHAVSHKVRAGVSTSIFLLAHRESFILISLRPTLIFVYDDFSRLKRFLPTQKFQILECMANTQKINPVEIICIVKHGHPIIIC